jgi:hypothetical protein
MRIVHACLSNFLVDGTAYQENQLIRQHVHDGHDVLVLASTETHSPGGYLTYVEPSEYVGAEGARVKRLPYAPFLPHRLARKVRSYSGTYDALKEFCPEVILFHGACAWELRAFGRYASEYPEVLFYVDSHEDWNNSARTALSREVLHRRFYGPVLRGVLPVVKKVLCVSTESVDFVSNLYRVPKEMLEFYPLGGHPVEFEEYARRREATRRLHHVADGQILLVQSGKQTRRKKLLQSLRALSSCSDESLRMFVVGVLQADIREEAEALIAADSRVRHLGWKTPEELTDLLCAADVYLQPGTQSVTMQHSLCCWCAVILDDVPAHEPYISGNGWLLNPKLGISDVLQRLRSSDLEAMQLSSYRLATRLLDYRHLSTRILR